MNRTTTPVAGALVLLFALAGTLRAEEPKTAFEGLVLVEKQDAREFTLNGITGAASMKEGDDARKEFTVGPYLMGLLSDEVRRLYPKLRSGEKATVAVKGANAEDGLEPPKVCACRIPLLRFEIGEHDIKISVGADRAVGLDVRDLRRLRNLIGMARVDGKAGVVTDRIAGTLVKTAEGKFVIARADGSVRLVLKPSVLDAVFGAIAGKDVTLVVEVPANAAAGEVPQARVTGIERTWSGSSTGRILVHDFALNAERKPVYTGDDEGGNFLEATAKDLDLPELEVRKKRLPEVCPPSPTQTKGLLAKLLESF